MHQLPQTGYLRLPQIVGNAKAKPPIPAVIPVSKSSWWQGVKKRTLPKAGKTWPTHHSLESGGYLCLDRYYGRHSMKALNKATENPTANSSINLIIHGSNNQLCVDSRDIAKEFGRQHKNVLQTLDDLLADGTISWLESKPRNYQKLGREYL